MSLITGCVEKYVGLYGLKFPMGVMSIAVRHTETLSKYTSILAPEMFVLWRLEAETTRDRGLVAMKHTILHPFKTR